MLIIVYGKIWTGKNRAVAEAIAKNKNPCAPNLHVLLSENLKHIREYGPFANYYSNIQDFNQGLACAKTFKISLDAEKIDGKPIRQVIQMLCTNILIPPSLQCIVVSYLGATTKDGVEGQLQRIDGLSMQVNMAPDKTVILEELCTGQTMKIIFENLTAYGVTHTFIIENKLNNIPTELLKKALVVREQITPYDCPIFIEHGKV